MNRIACPTRPAPLAPPSTRAHRPPAEHRSPPPPAILLLVACIGAPVALRAESSPVRMAYERLERLAGAWQSRSTNGWEGRIEVESIAAGTVVLMRSEIDPHAGQTMLTAYHLDGDRLLLTHYCVAGNQPRLEATDVSADGRRIVFTFRDATGMRSRDEGHMDRAVLELGNDNWTSQWTWYEEGEEGWMEKIEYVRAD